MAEADSVRENMDLLFYSAVGTDMDRNYFSLLLVPTCIGIIFSFLFFLKAVSKVKQQ